MTKVNKKEKTANWIFCLSIILLAVQPVDGASYWELKQLAIVALSVILALIARKLINKTRGAGYERSN